MTIKTNWTNRMPMSLRGMASNLTATAVEPFIEEEGYDVCVCDGCDFEEDAYVKVGGAAYQNDWKSFIGKRKFSSDTITFKLLKSGLVVATLNSSTYGQYYDFGDALFVNSEVNFPDYKGFIIDWSLVQQGLGYGKYVVRVEIVSLGVTYTKDSHTFNVVEYNSYRADGSVKIEGYQNGLLQKYFDYTGLNWPQMLRIKGKFGNKKPSLTNDLYESYSRTTIEIQSTMTDSYDLETELIPSSINNFLTYTLIRANTLLITDYNLLNQELYRRKPVYLSSEPDVTNHELSTKISVLYKLKDKTNNDIKRNSKGDVGLLPFISPPSPSTSSSLTVDFSVNDVTANTNQSLSFSSTVTGVTPILWEWDFGDGTSSNDENPTKTYLVPGTYTVVLFATDGTNSGYVQKTNYIVVILETPPQTNLQAWYKAGVGASPSNMTLSSGKVTNWVDAINAYNISQGTAIKQPAYTANLLNGYGGLTFTAHQLSVANGAFTRATGSTVIIVFKLNALGGTDVLHEASVSNYYEVYFVNSEAVMYNTNFRPSHWGITKDPVIMTNCFDGANSYNQYNNQTKELVGNTGTSSSSGFTLGGATGSSGSDVSATVYEVMVYSAEPSGGDLTLIKRYLSTKFGIEI